MILAILGAAGYLLFISPSAPFRDAFQNALHPAPSTPSNPVAQNQPTTAPGNNPVQSQIQTNTPPQTSTPTTYDPLGQWSGTSKRDGLNITLDITADTIKEHGEGPISGSLQPIKVDLQGTYTRDGNKLTVKTTAMHVLSDDPKMKENVDEANRQFTPDYISKLPPIQMDLDWKDQDTLVITSTDPKGTDTLNVKRGPPVASSPPLDSEHQEIQRFIDLGRQGDLYEDQLRSWTPRQRYYVRNGMYALHQGSFSKSQEVTDFFSAYPWYKPMQSATDTKLPWVEDDSVKLIHKVETDLAKQGIPIYKPAN